MRPVAVRLGPVLPTLRYPPGAIGLILDPGKTGVQSAEADGAPGFGLDAGFVSPPFAPPPSAGLAGADSELDVPFDPAGTDAELAERESVL